MANSGDPDQSSKNNQEYSKVMAALSSLAALVFVVVAILALIFDEDVSIRMFLPEGKPLFETHSIFILFLICHHLRVWCGMQFMYVDKSFGLAKKTLGQRKRVWELGIFIVLFFTVAVASLFVGGRLGFEGLAALLSVQALSIITYDVLFWRELFVLDENKMANKFIFVGDVLTVIMAMTVVMLAVVGREPIGGTAVSAINVLSGGLAAVFVGELLAVYYESVVKRFSDAIRAASEIVR
jgi:hypothetical protein